jgi:hypothetical protein
MKNSSLKSQVPMLANSIRHMMKHLKYQISKLFSHARDYNFITVYIIFPLVIESSDEAVN